MQIIKAKRQKGFTLIEQLITLALGALLLTGVASSVTAISRAKNLIKDYSHIQETLNFFTSSLTRTARTANDIEDYKDIVSNTSSLVFSQDLKIEELERTNCLAKKSTARYVEAYAIENNNLVCEVNALDGSTSYLWEGKEVLVYGVESFSFECAEYQPDKKIEFVACDSLTDDKIIAVKVDLVLSKNEFLQVKDNLTHSFTAYLRSNHLAQLIGRD